MTRVLIIDDHPIVLQGCRRMLEDAGIDDVLEARDIRSGYRLYRRHHPDVVIVDLALQGSGLSGLDLIRRMHSHDSRARILVFSMHSEAVLVKGAFNAGASGYVTKSTEPAVLVQAIRSVARGERAMSDDVAQVLAFESLTPSGSILDQLGEREIEILRQLAAGSTTEQIAANLNISIKTVQNYHYLIKTKTGMRTDAQLVRLAAECGLTSL
jgi:two-component system, NarL family, invasion response regulator UvrY